MTDGAGGQLLVFVYVAAVVLSLPAAAVVLLLSRRVGVRRAAGLVLTVVLAVLAIAALAVGLLAGPVAGTWLAGGGLAALALLWVLPVRIGWSLMHWTSDLGPDAALGYAVAGLPAGLLASAVWFVAPGGLARYNLTFLSGPALWLGTAGFLLTVLVGPGLVVVIFHRVVLGRS